MTKPELIGAKNGPISPKQDPPKEIPAGVKVIQIDSMPLISPMGQSSMVVFGLGDNGEVYVWNMQTRKWVER